MHGCCFRVYEGVISEGFIWRIRFGGLISEGFVWGRFGGSRFGGVYFGRFIFMRGGARFTLDGSVSSSNCCNLLLDSDFFSFYW